MIFKSDLVDAINGLSHDLTNLSIRVHDLERNIAKLDSKMLQLKKNSCPCKDSKGLLEKQIRDAANAKVTSELMGEMIKEKKKKITKIKKSTNAKKQPRGKDGKFAKK